MRNVLLTIDFLLRVPDGKTVEEQERYLKSLLNRALPKSLVFDYTLKDRTLLTIDESVPARPMIIAPNGKQFPRCKIDGCTMAATRAIKFRRTGKPYSVGVDDPNEQELCEWHASECLDFIPNQAPASA